MFNLNVIKNFYNQHVTKEDRFYLSLIGVVIFIGLTYITINKLFFHFTGIFYDPSLWLKLTPIVAVLMIIGMYARTLSPRMGYFTRSYCLYFLIVVALGILTTGIQYTPFPLIDQHLVNIDKVLGFHSIALLNWTYAHPHIKHFFQYAYASIGFQLFIIPLLIAFWGDKKGFEVFLITLIFSYLVGTTIYYFLPSAGLTSVFHSPHLSVSQHDTYLKFYEIHHRLPIKTEDGGMIAFPSFHVIWAILLTYACRHKKLIFYPLILMNLFVILSTLFLGWHYLTDVLGAFIVSTIIIYLAEKIYHRYFLVCEKANSI